MKAKIKHPHLIEREEHRFTCLEVSMACGHVAYMIILVVEIVRHL